MREPFCCVFPSFVFVCAFHKSSVWDEDESGFRAAEAALLRPPSHGNRSPGVGGAAPLPAACHKDWLMWGSCLGGDPFS